jgi:hypothetical protein
MNAILYAIVMWVLLQLLFVWFCVRLAAVRELDVKDYLELQAYLIRNGLDVSAHEPQQQSVPRCAYPSSPTTSRDCSSVTVPPAGHARRTPARPLRAPTGCAL